MVHTTESCFFLDLEQLLTVFFVLSTCLVCNIINFALDGLKNVLPIFTYNFCKQRKLQIKKLNFFVNSEEMNYCHCYTCCARKIASNQSRLYLCCCTLTIRYLFLYLNYTFTGHIILFILFCNSVSKKINSLLVLTWNFSQRNENHLFQIL